MKDRVIVVTNLGEFKAYRIHQDRNSSARLEPIPAEDTPNEHAKRSNTLTVMEGKSASTPSNQGTTAPVPTASNTTWSWKSGVAR
jgi:hypothetical protein